MAKSSEGDKWSATSSDLGSGFDCEGDLGTPLRDLGNSHNVTEGKVEKDKDVSVDGSAVTLDSLDDSVSVDRLQNKKNILSLRTEGSSTERNCARSNKPESTQNRLADAELEVCSVDTMASNTERSTSREDKTSVSVHSEQRNGRRMLDEACAGRCAAPAVRPKTLCRSGDLRSDDSFYLHESREHQDRSSSGRSSVTSARSSRSSGIEFRSPHSLDEGSPSPASASHGCGHRHGGLEKSLSVPENPALYGVGDRLLTTRRREFSGRSPDISPSTPPPIPRRPPRGLVQDFDESGQNSARSSVLGVVSQIPRRGLRQDLCSKANSHRASPSSSATSVRQCRRASLQDIGRLPSPSDADSICSSTGVPAMSKETLTSRMRHTKTHQDHGRSLDASDAYLTPSQRKDLLVKDLRRQVRMLEIQLVQKEQEMEILRETFEAEKEELRATLERQVKEAQALASMSQAEVTSLQESHEESVKTVATLQQALDDHMSQMAERAQQTEQMFLDMYNKGRESATFEREEELELMKGVGGKDPKVKATITDLRNKLVRTQAELAKWQTIRRREAYHTAPVPNTEAETTLAFLKDSVFHYLTDSAKVSDDHLRAIVRILRFSEVEKQKIAEAVIDKRNRSATGS